MYKTNEQARRLGELMPRGTEAVLEGCGGTIPQEDTLICHLSIFTTHINVKLPGVEFEKLAPPVGNIQTDPVAGSSVRPVDIHCIPQPKKDLIFTRST